MSKVVCDICGTVYQDTAECCPICGCARDVGAELDTEDLFLDEEVTESAPSRAKGGRFAAANGKRKSREIFDFDAENPPDDEDEDADDGEVDEEPYDEDDQEEPPRSNTVLVVLLTIVIVLLIVATGFIFFRYFLPNMLDREDSVESVPTSEATLPTTEESTEPAIPCQSLVLTGGMAELNQEGQMWLLHVLVMPEDTTDTLTYTSADESIATVTADGRVTAVSEGETTVYITCGSIQISCPVVVRYVEETEPPTEETEAPTEGETTAEGEDPTGATEQTKQTEASQGLKDVTLKLKQTDFRLMVGYGHTLLLDCDLEQEEVEWSSEHPGIATVDEKGFVKAVSTGTTAIIVKYGDQEVQCLVRCYVG